MTEIKIENIRVGMKLRLNLMVKAQYLEWGQVEAIGHDWVLVRAENATVHLLTDDLDYIEKYNENDDEEDIPLQETDPICCERDDQSISYIRYDGLAPTSTNPYGNPIFVKRRS